MSISFSSGFDYEANKITFQLTRPRGARQLPTAILSVYRNFNSHAHKGRDLTVLGGRRYCYNFNSHTHEGRDQLRRSYLRRSDISTHTPTRDATANLAALQRLCPAFQLTRLRGARHYILITNEEETNFNSHVHEGHETFYYIFSISVIPRGIVSSTVIV